MDALNEAILTRGKGIGSDIVKVDSFLNHRIDVALATRMGQAFHDAFADAQVDLILTVESSGIATAITTAQAFGNIPVVFAKKGDPATMDPNAYTAQVYSFTHKKLNCVRVSRQYLEKGMRVLIIDDFLANGEAVEGLRNILEQAGCECVGAGICVEKGFQPGGAKLREQGIKVVSLAIVDAIEDGHIILRNQD
ncbi:MAG: xanthine phosphoribosyltransferase [Clostridia bacterium]|nr:xanthine phosphoribosyltransferase [Clostridia bacterium]